MSTNEGTRRIRLLAKHIMLFGSLPGIALWILMSVLKSGGEAASGSIEGRPGLAELFNLIALPSHVALSFGLSHGLWKAL